MSLADRLGEFLGAFSIWIPAMIVVLAAVVTWRTRKAGWLRAGMSLSSLLLAYFTMHGSFVPSPAILAYLLGLVAALAAELRAGRHPADIVAILLLGPPLVAVLLMLLAVLSTVTSSP
ncbi:MAG TPA: hypothetical protein VIK99_04745 [Thermaerobacter sp.]